MDFCGGKNLHRDLSVVITSPHGPVRWQCLVAFRLQGDQLSKVQWLNPTLGISWRPPLFSEELPKKPFTPWERRAEAQPVVAARWCRVCGSKKAAKRHRKGNSLT